MCGVGQSNPPYQEIGLFFIMSNAQGQPGRFSAFTVSKLGEMFPLRLMCTAKVNGEWMGYHNWGLMTEGNYAIHATTEADARAKCLIYLVENKLVTL